MKLNNSICHVNFFLCCILFFELPTNEYYLRIKQFNVLVTFSVKLTYLYVNVKTYYNLL